MSKFIKAIQGLHHSVIYTDSDGRHFRRSDGTWPWRNNNPGDLCPGEISKRHNQLGVAGGFAVFPDYETGHEALLDCLKTKHGNQSIDQLIDQYAPLKENPHNPEYKKDVHEQTGVMDDTKIEDFTSEQFESLWQTIEKWEDWKEGTIVEVFKISCTQNDKKGSISTYCVANNEWVTKEECENLIKQGKIEAEICHSKTGNIYLRTSGYSSFQKNFDDIVEKNSEK